MQPTFKHNHARYNAENQLIATAGVTYAYDGDGRRVQKSSGKLYWYGLGSDVLDETDLTGVTTNAAFKEYVFFGGKRIARRDSTNAVNYYFADHLGTARIVANSASTVLDDSDFYPFGGERTVVSSSGNRYKFTGKERDSESGLDNFGARYNSSSMGRFMTPDWSAAPMGVPYADFDNPQSLNLYSYVKNNPLNLTDPTGHYELNASNCGDNAKCQKKYDKAANKFEKRREKDLKSKKADVRAAAANYGARGEANGVHLGFGNLNTGANPIYGSVDASGSTPGNPNIQVTLDFGRAGSAETQTHEGAHVGDDQKFLNSYDPTTGGYNQALNPTHGQTEFNAFKAGAAINQEHGFGPNDTQKILNFLHTSPTYGPIFNIPVFNPANFPAGVPDE